MILLDTDMLTLAMYPDTPAAVALQSRITQLPNDEQVATTVITYEEQTRGWLAFLASAKTPEAQVNAYRKLLHHLDTYRKINVIPYDIAATAHFASLRKQKHRVSTYDLRIAAIALSQNALLLTRNLRHFRQVPGLRAEDWSV